MTRKKLGFQWAIEPCGLDYASMERARAQDCAITEMARKALKGCPKCGSEHLAPMGVCAPHAEPWLQCLDCGHAWAATK